MAEQSWPPLPEELRSDNDAKKARAEAIAASIVKAAEAERGSVAAAAKAQDDLNQKMIDTLVTVTTGAIDRARDGAKFVQTAATAIAGLYTGVLGVLFVADVAAPSTAFIPMVFLGLAIVLTTYYLSFITPGGQLPAPPYENHPERDVWVRFAYIVSWVREISLRRANALRAAVVSLLFGLVFLPVVLIDAPNLALVRSSDSPGQAAPSPAPIDWPLPSPMADASHSVLLYAAQLEQFREDLDSASSTTVPQPGIDLAWFGFLGGLIVVGLVASNPLDRRRRSDGGDVELPPLAPDTD